MDLVDDIRLYLPQYLSSSDQNKLIDRLLEFAKNGTTNSVYSTSVLQMPNNLLQGDGIEDVPYVILPNLSTKNMPVLLLSNTCDMSLDNQRMYSSRIMYAPILSLKKFEESLKKKFPLERVDSMMIDIRAQRITQLLYLPIGPGMPYEGLVFFDRAISYPVSSECVSFFCSKRMFSLSNFGFYLFLLKLSMHFTRIKEGVNRF